MTTIRPQTTWLQNYYKETQFNHKEMLNNHKETLYDHEEMLNSH